MSPAYATTALLLAQAIRNRALPRDDFSWVVEYLLLVIQTELATLLGESKAEAVAAFLWEEDPRDETRLMILTCAAEPELIGKSYDKATLLTWTAIKEKKPIYDGNRHAQPDADFGRYRSVAAFPIYDATQRRDKDHANVIAGLSVKSTRPLHFDNRIKVMYGMLQPALSLITLAFECRSTFGRQ